MSSESGSGTSAVGRAPGQAGGMSGYFHGFFGTSRKLESKTEPIRIPSRAEVANAESRVDSRSPFTPPTDDWTFGIFRKYSTSEEGTSLPQSSTLSGYGFPWSSKPLPAEVSQQIVESTNDSISPASSNQSISVGEISSRVRRDSDIFIPVSTIQQSTTGKDFVDSIPTTGQEFGKGAILSAYMSQQHGQVSQGVGATDGNITRGSLTNTDVVSSMTTSADGNITRGSMTTNTDVVSRGSMTTNTDVVWSMTTSGGAVIPGAATQNSADCTVRATATPHLTTKRKSLFDNERIEVNRKELNMIAPTSM